MELERAASSDDVLIDGEYGVSAYGPTILLQLKSPEAAAWLRSIFLEARRSRDGFDIAAHPRVRIHGVSRLRLTLRDGHGPYIAIQETAASAAGREYEWSASSAGWAYEASLLDPFVQGRGGHQYLTREGVDDALVEVSFLEPHQRMPAAGGQT